MIESVFSLTNANYGERKLRQQVWLKKILFSFISALVVVSFCPFIVHGSLSSNNGGTSDGNGVNAVFTHDTSLFQDVVANNVTIDPGVIVLTYGHNIYCTGIFTNYGSVVSGTSNQRNYTHSYGGSGGGAISSSNRAIANGSGYSTLVKGGTGRFAPMGSALNGRSAPNITLNAALIQEWYRDGFDNFLSGGDGQSVGSIGGGYGSLGLYLQASSILNYGTIQVSGQPGTGLGISQGLSGSGGGGVVILAYSNVVVPGTVITKGGASALSGDLHTHSGAGGNGQFASFQYVSPPVNPSSIRLRIPAYGFSGAYMNYSVTENLSEKQIQSYNIYKVTSVYQINQTFSVQVIYGKALQIPPYNDTGSFGNPYPLPFYTPQDMSYLYNGTLTSDTRIDGPSTVILNNNSVIYAGNRKYNSIELGPESHKSGIYEWIDSTSGMLVKENTVTLGLNYTIVIHSTNIFSTHTNYNLFLALAVIVAIITVVLVFIYIVRNRSAKEEEKKGVRQESRALQSRIDELRSMKESHIITDEYYQSSMLQLLELNDFSLRWKNKREK